MPAHPGVALRNVSFSYDSSQAPLIADLSVHFPSGFTGIVGANGAGKTTLLHLLTGQLAPTTGHIEAGPDTVYCAQRTDHPPASLQAFLEDWDGQAYTLRSRLDVGVDYLERWSDLSHGERKRTQIAHALWQTPAVLAIDEPTNHIDASARDLLVDALTQFRGVGLIVSHDRELLDQLCCQCLWLDPPDAKVYSGGVSQASEQRQTAHHTAVRQRDKALNETKRLQREISKRRQTAASEHQARSKKGLSTKDSDAREKIDRARVTDSSAGSQLRQLTGRYAQSLAKLTATTVKKEYQTGIWLAGSRSRRDTVLTLPAGQKPLGDDRMLHWPEIILKPDQRVALTGRNGAGKSTWIHHIQPLLNVPQEHQVFLPQEVSAAQARSLIKQARSLPKAQLGHIMTIVSRLNSRPERLLQSDQPSPGEVRKLLLAMGMSRLPHIIVMDEPTNHLDLLSIEALESALADCPCTLLLVSHDRRFIDQVGAQSWSIETQVNGDSVLRPSD